MTRKPCKRWTMRSCLRLSLATLAASLAGARDWIDWGNGSVGEGRGAERSELGFLPDGVFCGVGVGHRWAWLTWQAPRAASYPPYIWDGYEGCRSARAFEARSRAPFQGFF